MHYFDDSRSARVGVCVCQPHLIQKMKTAYFFGPMLEKISYI